MTVYHPAPGDEGERVDAFLARRTGLPRTIVQAALRAGTVTVGGAPVKASYRVSAGDEITAEIEVAEEEAPAPEDIPLTIRYSDDRVLVVSKPAGLVTHPGHGNRQGTLVNALLALGGPLSSVDPARPGIVHRLDKDTSGLLLVARDDDAHGFLAAAIKAREVERRYVSLVRGTPAVPTGTIEAPVGRHPTRRRQMAVVSGGRAAVTHYRVISSGERMALLEVTLETGRTHQIRVHLSHLGHPVLGDRVYGGLSELSRSLGLKRPFLHAWRLAFPHPADGRTIEVADDLPGDLIRALTQAGLSPPAAGPP